MRNIDKFLFKTTIGKCAAVVALLMACMVQAVAQTDYSGVYYIGSVGYNSGTPNANYYLCPTEGWCYYYPVNDFCSDTVPDNPFLTTYKCKGTNNYDATKAVWTIEKAPNLNYYYIKQTKTGKYLLCNGQIRTTTNADRMRVHLEAVTGELDDKALFAIEPYSDYLTIRIVSSYGINGNNQWLVVNGGNKQSLKGESGKDGGPTGYVKTAGIVGIYTQNDPNAKFYLEPATIAPPVITNNNTTTNTFTITAAEGATIYYTTDGTTPTTSTPTNGSSPIQITQTESMTVIKALAKHQNDDFPTIVTTYKLPVCDRPMITVANNNVTITCSTPYSTIYYTDDNTPATTSSTPYGGSFSLGTATIIRAIATSPGYFKSNESVYAPSLFVHSSSEIVDMSRSYVLASDFTSTAPIGTEAAPFTGIIDGQLNTLSGFTNSLVAYANGAVIKNVILKNVTVSGSGNVGAICNEAKGYTRIYNCGILPTNPDFTESTRSSVTSTGNGSAGGIVGLLDDDSRVVNCFSYADVNSAGFAAGIVGSNTFASDASVTDNKYANLRTMVVNCMFYGDITGGSMVWPVYGGIKITNAGATAINNYNFYCDSCYFSTPLETTHYYNCSWPAKYEYLTRYEFHRYLLNSNRELCGWWVGAPSAPSTMPTADVQAVPKDASLMAKWVLDRSIAPFPILKPFGKYSSPINIDADASWRESANKWEGKKLGTLSVTINPGSHAASGITTTSPTDFVITDMDTLRGDYCYRKIQLPYYNDVFGNPAGATWDAKYGGNYKEYVVTGWEITSTNGADGTFTADWQDGYNFTDRYCSKKDIYNAETNPRIFAQGGYYYVPYDVTEITITAHWGKAVYLGNGDDSNYYDRVDFDQLYQGNTLVSNNKPGTAFLPAGTRSGSLGNDQPIKTGKIATVAGNLPNNNGTVFDNALVLVGNHQYCTGGEDVKPSRSFTIMSADFDFDNEPDYCLEWQLGKQTTRQDICPIRFDFLPVIEIGLGLKKDGSTQYYSLGCYRPVGHFEVTETALIRFGQFEFSNRRTVDCPIILNGGIFEQYTKGTIGGANANSDKITYVIIGGNVRMPSFTPGSHVNSSYTYSTRHCAVNAIGGKIDYLYLTGNYNDGVTPNADNPHCYIDGGWFDHVAAAGKEGIDGNVIWKINHARIHEFYGGGTMSTSHMVVKGNIDVTIDSSMVYKYCGGPKFGDMVLDPDHPENNKSVTTRATGTTFGFFYGGGNGGTSYVQYDKSDGETSVSGYNWTTTGKVNATVYTPGRFRNDETGYDANYDMNITNVSTGTNGGNAVFRSYFFAAQFSATRTGSIENTLNGCKVLKNFYGAGNLGGVNGNVTSVLTDTEVDSLAFGAGFSARIPEVTIHNRDKYYPSIDLYTGIITPQSGGTSTTYTWTNETSLGGTSLSTSNPAALNPNGDGINYFYTTKSLQGLGTVSGNVSLTINGNSVIGTEGEANTGNVYGGGDESAVTGNTTVILQEGAHVLGNVYGGGNNGPVSGNSAVILQDVPTISGTTPFTDQTTVTITGPAGSQIRYTTGEGEPNVSYSDSFTLTETTTVKAIAITNGVSSPVVTKTFTKQP